MIFRCPDFDLQVHGAFCIILGGFTPSFIYGWKALEVYFHMQQTARPLELCGGSYAHFSGDYFRPASFRAERIREDFGPTRRGVPSVNRTCTPAERETTNGTQKIEKSQSALVLRVVP